MILLNPALDPTEPRPAHFSSPPRLESKGAYDKAIADYNEALALAPKGDCFYSKPSESLESPVALRQTVETAPQRWNSIRKTGGGLRQPRNARFQQGEFEQAIDYSNAALELDSRLRLLCQPRTRRFSEEHYDPRLPITTRRCGSVGRHRCYRSPRCFARAATGDYDKSIEDFNETSTVPKRLAL